MSNICVLTSSGRVKKKSLPCGPKFPVKLRKPTPLQDARLMEVLPIVRNLVGQSLESKRLELARHGYELLRRRVPQLCPVGTFHWYPRFGLYRVVVSAPTIDKSRTSYPYAYCIQILA